MTRHRVWTRATAESGRVLLDGKPLHLPSGAELRASSPALAEAIAAEWQAAPESFGPAHLPLTGLAGAAQERVAPDPQAMAATLATYAEADLLCYRAGHPPTLREAQHRAWQPWLDWAAATHGARLATTTGLTRIAQPPAALAALHAALSALDPPTLAALGLAIPVFGSCVLGLALAARAAAPESLFAASIVDEQFQETRWGTDASALARRTALCHDVALAARFMALASGEAQ